MVRFAFLALLGCPLALAIACGSDGPGTDEGGAGTAAEGGASAEAGAGGAPSDGGVGGAGQAGASTGGSAGASTGGGVGTGGNSETGGTSGDTGSGGVGGVPGGDGGHAGAGGEATSEIALTVNTSANVRAISPLIYGVNVAHGVTCSDAQARFTLCRMGGNPWSTYNWENNASNAGADSKLCSENNAALGASDVPANTITTLVSEAGQNAAAVVTIPILDYVAADKIAGTPYPLCSGDVSKDANYLTTRLRHNQARKGTALADPPDVSDGNVSQDEFLSYLKTRSGTTKVLFTLDNQPELWGQTHIAVHPDHSTYEEVVARNVEYAAMIRDTWSGAEITGYGGYGYYPLFNLQDAPNPPGNSLFIDYYLAAMQEASTTAGKRLIDYFDMHFYSEVTPAPESRVQAPRTLWDPTYAEDSWIGRQQGPIRLVPWLLEKIATYYPGTKLAISSYAYGGEDEISGGLAVADVLGIFGREGVSMAAVQPEVGSNAFALAAFAAFRNYDGAGAAFGDQSVGATTSDVGRVSIYASTDSLVADRVVIVAINRSTEPSVVNLDVQGSTTFSSADVYVLSSEAAEPRPAAALTTQSANSFHTTLPGYSVSVIVPKP